MIVERNPNGTFVKGSKGIRTGVVVSEASRLKMRAAKLGKKANLSEKGRITLQLKNKGNKYNLGKKQSAEVVKKRMDKMRGILHTQWKGENVGYEAMHKWVKRNFGKANKCERCNIENYKKYHWHNKTQTSKRDINDWEQLCSKCHAHEHKNWEKRWQKSA